MFGSKIGEGASAIVYKYERQNNVLALKLFRNPLNRKKTIRIAEKLFQSTTRMLHSVLGIVSDHLV